MKKLALSFAFCLVALPCLASSDAPMQKAVRTSDLNLESQAGVDALYRRLESAARSVCSPAEGRSLAEKAQWKQCMSQTMDSTVASVDHDGLSRLHASKAGAPTSVARH
ncbi:MAG: UrcA family protein [Deltaproteobacteria bacterium]|nr:UrcA family protein [Deltaproteobacteria bacterium]